MTAAKYVPPQPKPRKFTSVAEVNDGIARLERCLVEARALGPAKVRYNDQKVRNVETSIQEAVLEVFGANSPQYQEHADHRIWHGGRNVGDDDEERQRKFEAGIPQTVVLPPKGSSRS